VDDRFRRDCHVSAWTFCQRLTVTEPQWPIETGGSALWRLPASEPHAVVGHLDGMRRTATEHERADHKAEYGDEDAGKKCGPEFRWDRVGGVAQVSLLFPLLTLQSFCLAFDDDQQESGFEVYRFISS